MAVSLTAIITMAWPAKYTISVIDSGALQTNHKERHRVMETNGSSPD